MGMSLRRPVLSVESLLALAIAYILVAFNGPFWRAALVDRALSQPSTWVFAAAMGAFIGALYFVVLAPLSLRWTVRPLLSLALVAGAGASYFIGHYGVFIDHEMMRNVLATNPAESRELVTAGMVGSLLLWGVLPAALVWWPRLRARRLAPALGLRLAWMAAAAVVGVGALLPVFADFASLMRNHREVRHLITPGNVFGATASNLWENAQAPSGPRQPVGPDARLAAAWQHRTRPALFVLVVGETARAANFSLNGYPRPTTPELQKREIVNFPNAWACGTSTEVSLPCMFSATGRRDYNERRIRGEESLLHVLARAGLQVLWRDNQSGCKGVCEGLPQQDVSESRLPGLCQGDSCFDEVLLQGLDPVLADRQGNLFLVMHQIGSHGPSYWRRYPEAFKRFTPACESDDLRKCSPQEIVNAYDNTIAYTDHVLARLIDFLQARQDRYDTAMLYVSDHGESLGEKGLYLHGVPYAIAPEVQRHVPMLAWFSPGFRKSFGLDADCLRRGAGRELGHDHIFHSMLGLMDVSTQVYQRPLDLFADCRRAASAP